MRHSPLLSMTRSRISISLRLISQTDSTLGPISSLSRSLQGLIAPSQTTLLTLPSLLPAYPLCLGLHPITRRSSFLSPQAFQKLVSSVLKTIGCNIKTSSLLSSRVGSRHWLVRTQLGSWPLASNRRERRQRFGRGVQGHQSILSITVNF